MEDDIDISICVPALNEERSLREAVEDLLQILTSHVNKIEVIIVDDASTDLTPQIADKLAKEYCQIRVIHHAKKMGIGACYRDALAIAQGNYFSWFPADHENSAEEFLQCISYLRQNTLVTCHHQGQDSRFILRRWISRIYTWVLNKFFHLNLKYYNGLTIFPTLIPRSLPLVANGFLFTAENLIKAINCGHEAVELSAPLRKRVHGKSNAFTFSSFKQMIRDIFCIILQRIKSRN